MDRVVTERAIPASPDTLATVRRTARRFLLSGAALAALLVFEWLLVWGFDARLGGVLAAAASSQLLFGREAAIPLGLGGGAPAWLMFQFSVVQDIAEALLGFGAFLMLLHQQERRHGWLARWYERTRRAAMARRPTTHRWGGLGLFVFMLLPFLVNGPLVGAVIGEFGGLSRRLIGFIVIGATAVSAALWTIAASALLALADGLPVLIAALSAAGAAFLFVSSTLRNRRAAADVPG